MISEIATVTRNDDAKQSQLRPPKPPSSGSNRARKPWLRHIEDLRMIGCTGLFFVVFIFAWGNYTSPLSGGVASFVTWLSLFQLSFMGAVATHNAIHVPVFWKPVLNNLYQICLSLQYGFPVSVFVSRMPLLFRILALTCLRQVPGHNLSHHKYPQQARDISEFRSEVWIGSLDLSLAEFIRTQWTSKDYANYVI